MIIVLMFALGMSIIMGLTELILFGLGSIQLLLKEKRDKDENNEKYEKYLSMFKYNP